MSNAIDLTRAALGIRESKTAYATGLPHVDALPIPLLAYFTALAPAPAWEASDEAAVRDAVIHDAARKVVTSNHYLILSPSRDIDGHAQAALHGSTIVKRGDKLSQRDAALRAQRITESARVRVAQDSAGDWSKRHVPYQRAANIALGMHLRAHRLPFVRAVGGFREAGSLRTDIPTEGSFLVHNAGHLGLHHALHLGHFFGQDSIIYHGPDAGPVPRLYALKYSDEGHPVDHDGRVYNPLTQEHESRKPGVDDENSFNFHPDHVAAMTPDLAKHYALTGQVAAFTHAHRGSDIGHANPRPGLHLPAFALTPEFFGSPRTAIPHTATR